MKKIEYTPIGRIRTPFKTPAGTPIQPAGSGGMKAEVEVFSEYAEGLADLEGFSHIILIYLFHLAKEYKLKVKPFLDNQLHGLFATRAPARPNPIGVSVVRLVRINDAVLHIEDIDVVDQTPLLDIKPYIPEFDIRKADRIGWIEKKANKVKNTQDDGRFAT
ncbi:MAG: tRNA (N6-threonylcarbamoyladenosine(37)-N6)-methyltransferase TrmO [Thermodesulfobacteriota bacterium]|nr:tRNA (N6-threonylcarbamoyladenosine(37)-N6)-methyltransferase TrmO [Thermodesulfobacteriota bacterium]